MTAILSPLRVVLDRLPDAKKAGKGWQARCPAHQDRSPSLNVTEADQGKVLLHCHAGCESEAVLQAIGLTWKDLFAESLSPDVKRDYQRKAALEAKAQAKLVIAMAAASTDLSPEDQNFLEQAKANAKQAEATLARLDQEVATIHGSGHFLTKEKGIYFSDEKDTKWLCGPLKVLAKTRDLKSSEWGRLLQWQDDDHVVHRWAMPMEMLQGDGQEVLRELSRQGLAIAPGRASRDLLLSYLQVWPVDARARSTNRPGWHGNVYLTPSNAIGEGDEIVVFQNTHALEPAFATAGSILEWKRTVAALASGNSRMVFTISTAFAGPLAALVGESSGGFHLRGGSSCGKSTGLKAAASVWGPPESYRRLWRATTNALEGMAALHNDGLLILDEISQADPRAVGEAAYMLANEQGKVRATRHGTARQAATWRLLFLSAGEESLPALMAKAGQRPNAGQEIRLADIPADAGAGLGAFEQLHDYSTGRDYSDAMMGYANRFYGVAGEAWLRHLVRDRDNLATLASKGMDRFVESALPAKASGQVARVSRRFALVAAAGELATQAGLTGWEKGEARQAVMTCFNAWLDSFGGPGNQEERVMLAHIRAFFEAHGASRFEPMEGHLEQRIPNRAGFVRQLQDSTQEYLIFPTVFREEVCQGLDYKAAEKALLARGWITPGGDRPTQKPRLPGMGACRVYVFNPTMWTDEGEVI